MDALDIRIIDLLQKDAGLTQSEIADRVSSTPSTCLRRVQRLREAGYLTRCIYVADPKRLGRGIKAFISITTKDFGLHDFNAFINRLLQEPSIDVAYGTTGDVDAIVEGNFASLEEYGDMCARLFDSDPDVVRYTTHFAVQAFNRKRAISTDELSKRLIAKGRNQTP